jgi:hypothetical protein
MFTIFTHCDWFAVGGLKVRGARCGIVRAVASGVKVSIWARMVRVTRRREGQEIGLFDQRLEDRHLGIYCTR